MVNTLTLILMPPISITVVLLIVIATIVKMIAMRKDTNVDVSRNM